MPDLDVRAVDGDASLAEWQRIHNLVIPNDPLSLDEVRERATRNRLDLANVGDQVVGCSTVRPATDEDPVTVIVRIIPELRRRGLGSQFLDHVLDVAREMGAETVQTIVLGSNADGLEFAEHRGFEETERYVLDGATVPYIHLRRRLVSPAPS